jgi:uncharacterized membrane protein YdcZ (DUF606 family)
MSARIGVMLLLGGLGVAMIAAAPLIGRLLRRGGDPIALVRAVQLVGFVLLVVALVARPYNPTTSAVPSSPDAPMVR